MDFNFTLDSHEVQRRLHVLMAADDFDPAEAIAGEDEAAALLCSGLDAEQQATLDMLIEAGVLEP